MTIQVNEENDGKILIVRASGKLTKADYEQLIPEVDRLIQLYGTLHMLIDMTAFQGWEVEALWEEIKFGVAHFADIERLAIVGETKWQQGMATFAKPFTKATIQYFDHANTTQAQQWLSEAQHTTP
jgi:hypothetical protein